MKFDAKINTHDDNWIENAKILMRDRKTLLIENWDETFHDSASFELAQEFNYRRKILLSESQLVLEPRISN